MEAAFHFSSRRAFFEHCYRVLRPGGVVTMSDIAIQRWPRGPLELLSGLTQLRVFGLRQSAAMTAGQIATAAADAGLAEVEVTLCGYRVIAPAAGRGPAVRLSRRSGRAAGRRPRTAAAGRTAVAALHHRLHIASRDPALMRVPVAGAGDPSR